MAAHNELGHWGEQKAADFLIEKGYRILERDWHIGHRDLDIIALDSCTLVIVEVKTRTSDYFMTPEQAVNRKKIQSLTLAANAYVKMRHLNLPIRFDIVAITGTDNDNYDIKHIENAFLPLPIYRGTHRR